MLGNYLAAALRNLSRNRLNAVLNLVGLGAGFAAALLVALYVRHELTFESFLPHHEDVYRLSNAISTAGSSDTDDTKAPIAEALRIEFPQIRHIAQIHRGYGGNGNSLRRGAVEAREPALYWADPEVFEVLQFPVVAGDLRTALQSPDGLVLTRRMARKYFGTDTPIDATIEVNRQYTMRVMTARASRRAVEVSVRKAAGASRTDLAIQFIGESLIYSTLATVLACMAAELLLPKLSGFLDRDISFDWSASLVVSLVGATLLVGLLAGLYPAYVLSGFKPAAVLKGGVAQTVGAGRLRQLFVLMQFGILTGLVLATAIVHRQTAFGLRAGLRFDHDQLLSIGIPAVAGYCTQSAFTNGVRALPGVRGIACSNGFLLNYGTQTYRAPDGRDVMLENADAGPGLFELLGLEPVAGRFFRSEAPAEAVPSDPRERSLERTYPVVVNETAARRLGYTDPASAVGQVFVSLTNVTPGTRHEIIGVVPDFARDSVRVAIEPLFFSTSSVFYELEVKLTGQDVLPTLQAIDRLWNGTAPLPGPITWRFLDKYVQDLYRDLERQGTLFTVFASPAMLLAAVGLFGLAAFTAERRTREIGVRKALGASTSDVTRLLLWQFVKPVLTANLIAWPVIAWLMSRWLRGFAYHIDLPLWLFPAAAIAVLVIAVITVTGHSFHVARAAPIRALRHD